ncbi:MAG: hypothetical protein NXI32_05010 [bacterium]|nr:hypothetical protein [bacterium]
MKELHDRASESGTGLKEKSATAVAKRRELIASMRLRGATLLEIQEMLTAEGIVNHDRGGKPFSRAMISKDVKVIRETWAKKVLADSQEYYGRLLAEIQELKKASWSRGNHELVLKCLEREARMLGLDKPIKLDIGITDGDKVVGEVLAETPTEKLEVLHEIAVAIQEKGGDPRTVVGSLLG